MTARHTSSVPSAKHRLRWTAFALLAGLWLCSLPLACLPGPAPYAAREVLSALAGALGLGPLPPDSALNLVVGDIRLARVVLAALCGGALAVAGVALQGCLLYTSPSPRDA